MNINSSCLEEKLCWVGRLLDLHQIRMLHENGRDYKGNIYARPREICRQGNTKNLSGRISLSELLLSFNLIINWTLLN